MWFDEASTISAANRPLPDLARMLVNFDAVHGLYYLAMHEWFDLFPRSEFWARAPSSLAVGAAAAGVVVLGKLLSTRTVALTAGIIFAILPRVTWAGVEARSYAMTAMAAVWLTVVLLVAVRRQIASAWALYAATLILSMLLNIYLALLAAVHLCVIIALRRSARVLAAWAVSTALATGLLAPFLLFVTSQSRQVGWIAPLGRRTLAEVFRTQYFDHSRSFVALAGLAVGVAMVCRLRRTNRSDGDGLWRTLIVCIAWIVVPTGIILAYSAAVQPIYIDRYLCFTTPAMALLLAVCIVTAARRPAPIAVTVAAFALAALPNFVVQRGAYAKVDQDYSQVADLITAHASPGDCLLLDDTTELLPGRPRALVNAHPAAYQDLIDVGFGQSAVAAAQLWDTDLPPNLVADRIARCHVIWTISGKDPTLPAHEQGPALFPDPRFAATAAFSVPHDLGFRLVERWQFTRSQVTRAIR